MRNLSKAAIAALGLTIAAGPSFANDIGLLSPGTVGSTLLGSSDVVLQIEQSGARAQTIDAIDVTNVKLVNAQPGTGQLLDMSGRDGSLRSCYANGGIAQQGQDLAYRCEFDTAAGQGPLGQQPAQQSAYVVPTGVDSGYDGVSNVEDPALLDCVGRGGSLIQLSNNGQFACAM